MMNLGLEIYVLFTGLVVLWLLTWSWHLDKHHEGEASKNDWGCIGKSSTALDKVVQMDKKLDWLKVILLWISGSLALPLFFIIETWRGYFFTARITFGVIGLFIAIPFYRKMVIRDDF